MSDWANEKAAQALDTSGVAGDIGSMPAWAVSRLQTAVATALREARAQGWREACEAEREPVARDLHAAYERLAPEYSYETREATRKPWDEAPVNNRGLMTAAVDAALRALAARGPKEEEQ
jgi:hypothetical protein